LDSVWFSSEPERGDTLGLLWADFTDPAAEVNFYRLFTKRLNKDYRYIPVLGSVYDDRFFNGKQFMFSMFRGFSSLIDDETNKNDKEAMYFKIKDTIILKACAIDVKHYDFWRSAEQAMYSGGNPFVYPLNAKSNITGGALGVWGGYAAFYDTIIAR
jgi:hypothetical protein